MSTQAECVKVLQRECERLKQYLAALPQDVWTKPSACARWDVRDVVAHLIFAANYYTDCITRGLRGIPRPLQVARSQAASLRRRKGSSGRRRRRRE